MISDFRSGRQSKVVPESVPEERPDGGAPSQRSGPSIVKKVAPAARGLRRSLVDKAYHDLKHGILTNKYPPGFQATETVIAEREGMSRTPMREALLRLQNDGLVELMPRHGVRVLPIYPADLREIYEVLCCLEPTAAELLANRRLPLDAPEFREMEAANVAIDDALARGDLEAFAEMDDRFHRLLVTFCGNGRLMRLAFSISDQQHRARMLTLRLRPLPTGTSSEHRATLEAIQRGDARAAHELHRAHRVRGMNLILGLIEQHLLGHL